MCQLNLNTAKISIRRARCSIPSPNPMQHVPRNIPPMMEWDPAVPSRRSSHLPWPMQMAWFSILTSRKIMTEIANPHQMPTTSQSHTVVANCLGVPPYTPHVFHIHLCATPHIVHHNPCNTTPPMLPCEKCMTLLSDCAIFHLTANLCATSFGSLPCMATKTLFSTIPLLTFLALAFTVLNLLLFCNLNFTSFMLLSWLSFGYQTVCKSST